MPDNELHATLSDVLKSLNDDASRIALGTSLSHFSPWQGQLIQVQCEIAKRIAADPFRNEWQSIDHIERQLLSTLSVLERGFFQICPDLAVSFWRGLPEIATAGLPTLLDYGDECLAFPLFPFINRLHLTGDTARMDELSRFPFLGRIEHLWFAEALCNDEKIRTFLSSPHIEQMKSLNFRFWGDCEDKAVLADYGGVISPDGAEAIAASSALNNLQQLDMTFHDLGVKGTQYLANSTRLTQIQTLTLDLNDIGDNGLKALSFAASLDSLSSLSVRNNGISLDGVHNLISGKLANRIRCLRLSDNKLGADAGKVISQLIQPQVIRHLHLANCSIGDRGFADLVEFSDLSQLHSLNVNNNAIGPSFFNIFRKSHAIEHLSAINNELSDDMAECLHGISSDHNSNVRYLNLSDNKLGDDFARVFSECSIFRNLETLHLTGNVLGDIGASCIRQSEVLKGLQLISLDGSKLSTQEQKLLVERFRDGIAFR